MKKGLRFGLSVVLVLVGVLAALFFVALAGFTDCSDACKGRGERAAAYGLAACGVAVAVTGATLSLGPMRAVGFGLAAGGTLGALAAVAEVVRYGTGPLSLLVIALGAGAATGGLVLARPPT